MEDSEDMSPAKAETIGEFLGNIAAFDASSPEKALDLDVLFADAENDGVVTLPGFTAVAARFGLINEELGPKRAVGEFHRRAHSGVLDRDGFCDCLQALLQQCGQVRTRPRQTALIVVACSQTKPSTAWRQRWSRESQRKRPIRPPRR